MSFVSIFQPSGTTRLPPPNRVLTWSVAPAGSSVASRRSTSPPPNIVVTVPPRNEPDSLWNSSGPKFATRSTSSAAGSTGPASRRLIAA